MAQPSLAYNVFHSLHKSLDAHMKLLFPLHKFTVTSFQIWMAFFYQISQCLMIIHPCSYLWLTFFYRQHWTIKTLTATLKETHSLWIFDTSLMFPVAEQNHQSGYLHIRPYKCKHYWMYEVLLKVWIWQIKCSVQHLKLSLW